MPAEAGLLRVSARETERLPPWIRVGVPRGEYASVDRLLHELRLSTVCREARCPNRSECWSAGTATLMLLGSTCTRRCRFCAVETRSPGGRVDETEPSRVAEAVARWGLSYVVLTQVCRDDLEDGGARLLAETVEQIHRRAPQVRVELLVGDLGGREAALRTVVESRPDVLAHNLETVRRLSPVVRDRRAGYDRSLGLLREARRWGGEDLVTKSSLMLGLGEEEIEVISALNDLRAADVDLITFGQYLRPSADHLGVARYLPPEEFDEWAARARACGFAGVAAGPMVRSSYHADELFRRARRRRGDG